MGYPATRNKKENNDREWETTGECLVVSLVSVKWKVSARHYINATYLTPCNTTMYEVDYYYYPYFFMKMGRVILQSYLSKAQG